MVYFSGRGIGLVPALGGSGGAVVSSGGSSGSKTVTPTIIKQMQPTPSGGSSPTQQLFYLNPETGSYSTVKIPGATGVTRQQATQLTSQAQQDSAQQAIKQVAGFQQTPDQQLKLSPSKFQTGQPQFVSKSELSLSSFGSPTFIKKPQGTSSLVSTPLFPGGTTPSRVFDTKIGRGFRKYVGGVERPIKQAVDYFKSDRDFKEGYKIMKKPSKIMEGLEQRGVVDFKGNIGRTSSAFNNNFMDRMTFKAGKVAAKSAAKVSSTVAGIDREDVILAGTVVGETAIRLIPTTRLLSIGGTFLRTKTVISLLPKGFKGAAVLGTYGLESKVYRKIALDVYDYGKTDFGRSFTFYTNLLLPESYANIEGGKKLATLIASNKAATSWNYMKTKAFPGAIEGSLSYHAAIDYAGGYKDVSAIGLPFTDKSLELPFEFRMGGKGWKGWTPGITEKGTFRTGKGIDTAVFAVAGAGSAILFGGAEWWASGKKLITGGRVSSKATKAATVGGSKKSLKALGVEAVGYVADPMEGPGDIHTAVGGVVSGKTLTFVPTFETEAPPKKKQTSTKTLIDTKPLTDTKTKLLTDTKDTKYKMPASLPSKAKTKTQAFEPIKIKAKTRTDTSVFIDTKVDPIVDTKVDPIVDTKVDPIVDVPAITNVPATTTEFTDSFINQYTFTPKIPVFIPPRLPGGGGGYGGSYKPKFKQARTLKYTPSVVGIVTGAKRTGGTLTGLGIRGVGTTPKSRTYKKKKKVMEKQKWDMKNVKSFIKF